MLQIAIAQPDCRPKEGPVRQDFEHFVATHLPKFSALAYSFSRPDHDLAKDFVQEAIIKGYQAFMNGSLVLDSQARAWFSTVIRNEFLMHRRKSKRLTVELDAETVGSDGRVDFETLSTRELILNAIDELPDDQRDCVVLVDLHQSDYDEAAKVLGIPVGTVRSRLSRARVKLASRLNILECSL